MNYFLLAETDFFRLINEAGDCNMETAYTAFATQVIELCSGNVDTNRTIIALGASFQATDSIQIDAGYQHLMFDDAPINHVGSTGDRVVGDYDNVADIVGLSLTWRR